MWVASGSCDRRRSRLLTASVVASACFLLAAAGVDAAGLAGTSPPGRVLFAVALACLLPLAAALVVCWRIARRTAVAARGAEEIARQAAIVESSADAIIGSTLDGVATSWNAGAQRLYGYTAAEIVGHNLAEDLIVPAAGVGEVTHHLEQVRVGGHVEQFETKRRRKDGTVIDVSLTYSPIRDATGAVVGVATAARDISERARIETDRRALDRRLAQMERVESLGQLAGGIAHDFNNLLSIIMNYAEFVAGETAGDPAVQADIEQIQQAAQNAARITRQLLIVGRRDTAQREALELNAVVSDIRNLLARNLGVGFDIQMAQGTGTLTIEADRGQVEQVLLNLAVNARDAMPQGGTVTIETSLADLDERGARGLQPPAAAGRYVELAVSDTGTGISDQVAEHIFEPFFTTKPTGKGTGLGLATVYGVVTGVGGGIGVVSREGAGTTFRLFFPAAGGPAPVAPAAGAPAAQGHGQTILVVDDDPPVLSLTSRILRQNGYATMEAATFDEAVSLASSRDLQLLLTDSIMLHPSGAGLAQRVADLKPGVPILYMSGHSAQVLSPDRVLDERAEYIQKPFTPQALLEKVNAALAAQRGVLPPAS